MLCAALVFFLFNSGIYWYAQKSRLFVHSLLFVYGFGFMLKRLLRIVKLFKKT